MLQHRDSRRQRGFTLAEVMVATAIFAVIVIAALMIYDRSNRVFKESVESAAMQQETRVAFDKLVRDVRMAGFDFDRDGVPMISNPTVWQRDFSYAQNRVVIPTTHNGFVYIAVNGGQSGSAEPAWRTTVGEITNDNTIRWRAVQAVYQQPDEQIEYAGLSAITIRGNLDYTTDAANEHGREDTTNTAVPTYDYEPDGGQFPIVTTGNDEIVTYALRSEADDGPNDDEIRFYADVARPRAAYPGSGGAAETEVVIEGVDLCDDLDSNNRPQCIHPPYTLYRFTIGSDGRPDAGTPVANNIRSLKFFYYTSPLGGVTDANTDGLHDELLTLPNGTLLSQGAIGGLGQYDPNNVGATANFGHRAQREAIQSIRIQLVGMSEVADVRYVNPTETVSPPVVIERDSRRFEARQFRTYQLESLIVPRNVGLRGMEEPVSTTPTPPHIRSICHGFCNATRVIWDAPTSGGVIGYEVRYGPSWSTSNRALPNLATMPDGTSPARFPGDQLVGYVIIPAPPSGTQWYVNVRAINEHGITDSDNVLRSVGSINRTKPNAVTEMTAPLLANNDYEPNAIRLSWPRVTTNNNSDPSFNTLSCTTAAGTTADTSGTNIPSQENIKYRIWRSTDPMFDPTAGQGVKVLDFDSGPNNPLITPGTTTVNWTDDKNSRFGAPPANCTPYYYRIQAYDECRLATQNDPANATHGESAIYPAIGQRGIEGYAGYRGVSAPAPAAITGFRIDAANSRCRVGPNDCSIALVWNRVTADTASPTPNTISIDKYVIERQRKLGPSGTWSDFPLADPEHDNNSLTTGTTITFTDTTAQHHSGGPGSQRYYYQYRVRAVNCDATTGWTAFEDYPDICPSGSTVTITGTFDAGTGTWMMTSGDYVSVTPGSGVTLSRVDFQLIDPATETTVDSASMTTPPYIFAWPSPQDESIVFRLVVSTVQTTGCTEELVYNLQEDPGSCPPTTRVVTGASAGVGVEPSPYLFNAGDTIELRGPTDPAEGTLTSVSFQLFEADGTTAIGSPVVDASAPFIYTWFDRTDNTVYRVRPTVTFTVPPADVCVATLDDIFIRDEICSGATVTPAGQVSGDGLSSSTPWVMASGATITVNPPAGTTPQRVAFNVQAVTPAGSAEPTVTVNSPPFRLTWSDRTDETVYRVTMVVIYSSGCFEIINRFVKDDPAACKLQVDDPDGTILRITNVVDPTAQLLLRNNGTSDFVLQNIDITWNHWDAGITWDNVTFPSGDVFNIGSNSSSTQSIDLSPLPTGFTTSEVTIAPGGSMTLTLNFTESGNRDDIEATDIRKVCVTYTRSDTGTRQYACRILNATAPDADPDNPTRCE